MSVIKSVTTNTAYQSFSKLIAICTGLLITKLLTQLLSQADYGIYTLITSLIILVTSITDWGTGFISVRAASQNVFPQAQLFSNLLTLRLVAGLSGSLLMLVLGQLQIFSIPFSVYAVSALIIIPINLRNVALSIFQSRLNFRYHAISESSVNIFYFIFILYLIQHPPISVNHTILALDLANILALCIALILALRLTSLRLDYNHRIQIYLLKEAFPLGAQLILFSVYNRLDTYILQAYKGEATVALYGLSYKIYSHLVMGAAFIMNSLFPHISRTTDLPSLRLLYSRSYLTLLAFGFILGVATYITSPFIINLINPQYQASIPLLQILSLALPFAYINHLTGYTLIAQNRQWTVFLVAICSLLINAFLNFLLIPTYSSTAAAYITIITEATMLLITTLYLYSRLHLSPLPSSSKISK